jgi:hypothetical protein
MTSKKARNITDSGNVIYLRTQRGWVSSMGFWALLLPVSVVLLTSTLPPEQPYLDTAVTGLLFIISAWQVVRAGRQMLVAMGDNHLQYIGMGRAWYFYFRDLRGVDVADRLTAHSQPTSSSLANPDKLPNYLIFVMRNGNRVNLHLNWFDGANLLLDLDGRLPKKIERTERYRAAVKALKARRRALEAAEAEEDWGRTNKKKERPG